MIRPVPHVGAMAAYELADLGGVDTISLAQNESAFSASPLALSAGRAILNAVQFYPDPDWTDLRIAIAEFLNINPARILCGAGSMELVACLIRAYVGSGDHVLGTEYGYAFVSTASTQVQAVYVKAHENNLTVCIDHIVAAITPKTRIVFLCNPGNPTGTLIGSSDLIRLLDALPVKVLLVIDQAYVEFTEENASETFNLVDQGNCVVLRTFSKAYGLAGARVGWGYFPENIAHEVRKLLNPNNVSIMSQVMTTAAMRDQTYMKEVVSKTSAIRDQFIDDIRALGLSAPQSHTNFVLIRFSSSAAAKAADNALRSKGLIMRSMAGYGLADCLRATICTQVVMNRALTVLKTVCHEE